MECDLRHPPRPHPGAGQAGGAARAARARAAARGAAADRPGLGDAAAARAGRIGGLRSGARPPPAPRSRSSTAAAPSGASRSHPTGRSRRSPARCWPRSRPWPGRSRSIPRPRRPPGRHPSTRTPSTATYRPRPRSARLPWRRPLPAARGAGRRSALLPRGRSTPVNAWWGSFDLAVTLYSGRPADPPSRNFIFRNAMDAQEIALGWWPGDPRSPRPAFYAYAHPAPEGFAGAARSPPQARWDADLGEYLLDWDDVRAAGDPYRAALEFARAVVRARRRCRLRLGPGAGGERRGRPAPGRLRQPGRRCRVRRCSPPGRGPVASSAPGRHRPTGSQGDELDGRCSRPLDNDRGYRSLAPT